MKKLKSSLSFLLIILIFLLFGIVTLNGLFTLGNLTRSIYEHPLVVSNASLNAALNITKMHRSMKDVVLANSSQELTTALKAVAEAEQKVFQHFDIIKKDIIGEEGKAIEKRTRQLFVNWKPIREEVIQLLNSGDKQKAILITKGKGAAYVGNLESSMLELTAYARKKATGLLELAEASQSRLEKITLTLTSVGVFLSLVIAFIATSRLQKAKNRILDQNNKLQKALDEIKTLRGIIPICSYCKQIRDDKGSWSRLEAYICNHSEAQFSHGVCPECYKKQMKELDQE
ncbi:MAG: MCP four helix bundle domain-containing protein [Proteobacteria bacterium]|nr:MCP four helix bundle domain-containing protein [Pseudomonadota bacterium]MBU1233534.1 MCP four helix bundle domain-containing protein [Pseudomonadota bacterium]MBU1418659.1 MCP four helix bundle domain-containing protein [Pseudomonadota bacterium]MBU1456019.1 MCP four helix bundle domain-containing protein [Pseudomonadota bacterium]